MVLNCTDQDYSQTGGIANLQDAINLQLQGSSLTASVDGNGFLTIVSDFAGSGYDIQVADAITPDIFGTDPLTEIGRDADEGVNVTRTVVIYDSLGSSHRINVTYSKIGDNEWSWTATLPNNPNTILGSDRLVFNTSGALISGGKGTITIPADAIEPKLAKDITMEIHLGDLTQFGESTSVVLRNQNGLPSGALDSIAIDRSGIIIGSFSNGMTKNLAQVALARFDNPAGLLKAGNSIFQESNNSGQRVLDELRAVVMVL